MVMLIAIVASFLLWLLYRRNSFRRKSDWERYESSR
jgi:hypothetical protein